MSRRPNPRLWAALLVLVGTAAAAVAWVAHSARVVREEARERFYEQYNRQQLLLAEQAARGIEGLFHTFRKDLGLVVSLFQAGPVTTARAAEVKDTLQKMYESLADTPVMDLAVFDRHGVVTSSFPPVPGTVGVDLSWRDYFAWARDRGQPGEIYLTPLRTVVAGKATGAKALIVVEGIYGPGREFKGLALFTVDFDELARRHVLPVRIGEHGYAWLADLSDRSVLVDPRGRIAGLTFDEAFLPRWPGLHALLLSLADGRSSTGGYDFEDPADPTRAVRKLAAYHPVRLQGRLWLLGVSTPEREVEALLSSFLRRQEAFSATLGLTLLAATAVLSGVLLTWNRLLSRQVSGRTRDLEQAQARLETTFEELLAARSLAAVGHLALGLTHEIRNPLSAIRMNVQMIREESPSGGHLQENFAIVESEILRLNRLLNDLLGFARPRAPQLVQADLGEEARRTLRLMERSLAQERIEVAYEAQGDLGLRCDPEQVQQVLLNLVLNAVEAMREAPGPKRLAVGVAREGERVALRVADTGVGVRPEDRAQIFDPFFTTKAQGGGLGLATLNAVVLRHGGTVEVDSDGQSGATFTVRLPANGPPGAPGGTP
ncbi:MAG: sensor histidine kinase [Deferrisomatales bacterium]